MADKKISALASATTPLAGTEVLPIVQSGSTVKVPVSSLTAGRAIETTGINDANGNEIFKFSGTASAVNEITVANAATGNGPTISATGGDTNIDINIAGKGVGSVLMSKVGITGGTIDGTVIGGTTAAAITGTTITGQSMVVTGTSVPADGIYKPAANQVGIAGNSRKTAVFEAASGYGALYLYSSFGIANHQMFVSPNGYYDILHDNGVGSGSSYIRFLYNNVAIADIAQNGTTAVQYNTTSDIRLKKDVVDAPEAGSLIDQIRIVSHGWKSAPTESVKYGVIAQELINVVPSAVTQGDDGEKITKAWGVDYSKMIPLLIKEVQALRQRVATLEAALQS